MPLGAPQGALKKARLEEILSKLEAACCKHTAPGALGACAAAWRHALDGEGAAPLREVAAARYQKLCGKLAQA
eukprot:4570078-Prymnesium_polylepis.1